MMDPSLIFGVVLGVLFWYYVLSLVNNNIRNRTTAKGDAVSVRNERDLDGSVSDNDVELESLLFDTQPSRPTTKPIPLGRVICGVDVTRVGLRAYTRWIRLFRYIHMKAFLWLYIPFRRRTRIFTRSFDRTKRFLGHSKLQLVLRCCAPIVILHLVTVISCFWLIPIEIWDYGLVLFLGEKRSVFLPVVVAVGLVMFGLSNIGCFHALLANDCWIASCLDRGLLTRLRVEWETANRTRKRRDKEVEQSARAHAQEQQESIHACHDGEFRRVGQFYDLAGEIISVEVFTSSADIAPTVRDWRTALAASHFLVPGFRWVLIFDGEDIFMNDAEELVFEEGDDRILHAVAKHVPELPEAEDPRFAKLSEEQKKDRALILRGIESGRFEYHDLHAYEEFEFRNDREMLEMECENGWGFILDEVGEDGGFIIDDALRHDPQIVSLALKSYPEAFRHGTDALRDDVDVVGRAFVGRTLGSHSSPLLEHAGPRPRQNRDVVLNAIDVHPGNFIYASEDLRDDYVIVERLFAEKKGENMYQYHNDLYLQHVGSRCREIRVLVLRAIARHPDNFQYVAAHLRADRSFILSAAAQSGRILAHVDDPQFQDDIEIARIAVGQSPSALEFVSARLRRNPSIVLKAISLAGSSFEYASDELQQDKDVADFADYVKKNLTRRLDVELDPLFNPTPFAQDRALLEELIWMNPDNYTLLIEKLEAAGVHQDQLAGELLRSDRKLVELFFAAGGYAAHLSEEENGNQNRWRSDRGLLLHLLDHLSDAVSFRSFSEALRDDPDIVRLAIRHRPSNLLNASQRLQTQPGMILAVSGVKKIGMWKHLTSFFSGRSTVDGDSVLENTAVLRGITGTGGDATVLDEIARDESGLQLIRSAMRGTGARSGFFRGAIVTADWESARLVLPKNPDCLRHASEAIRDDKDLVLLAVRYDGEALRHASDRLRGDREVVETAIRETWRARDCAIFEMQMEPRIRELTVNEKRRQEKLEAEVAAYRLGLERQGLVALSCRRKEFLMRLFCGTDDVGNGFSSIV